MVTGKLIIPAGVPTFQDGTAHISLEDISYADAFSETVAEAVFSGIRHIVEGEDTAVPFALYASSNAGLDPKADYAVQAWIDCDADGRLGKGDLTSDQVYRVLTRGFNATATIILRQI
jgi:uncharacterized lipoprotein YbaY